MKENSIVEASQLPPEQCRPAIPEIRIAEPGTANLVQPQDRPPSPGDLSVDVAKLATLPDSHFEAGIHRALDRLIANTGEHPLDVLAASIDLMQGLNAELAKAYAPAVVINAQDAASEAQQTGKPITISREQSRAIATLARIQETMAKMAAARVKVADEQARRRQQGRAGHETE